MLSGIIKDLQHLSHLKQTLPMSENFVKAVTSYKDVLTKEDGILYQLRVTTKPNWHDKSLSFRWVDVKGLYRQNKGFDAYETAMKNNLFYNNMYSNSIIDKAYSDCVDYLNDKHIKFTYALDISGDYGLEKIWLFLDWVQDTESMIINPNIVGLSELTQQQGNHFKHFPKSITKGNFVDIMNKYELNSLSVFGFDFRNITMNLYHVAPLFVQKNDNVLNSLINEFNFPQMYKESPLMALYQDLPFDRLMALNFTFDFDDKKDNIIRLCPYWLLENNNQLPECYNQQFSEKDSDSDLGLLTKAMDFEKQGEYITGVTICKNRPMYGKVECQYKSPDLNQFYVNAIKMYFQQFLSKENM